MCVLFNSAWSFAESTLRGLMNRKITKNINHTVVIFTSLRFNVDRNVPFTFLQSGRIGTDAGDVEVVAESRGSVAAANDASEVNTGVAVVAVHTGRNRSWYAMIRGDGYDFGLFFVDDGFYLVTGSEVYGHRPLLVLDSVDDVHQASLDSVFLKYTKYNYKTSDMQIS